MSINLRVPPSETELKPSILVVGVGGAGGNAVNNMIRSSLEGVEFLVCNTDSQALTQSLAERRIQLGHEVTQGLGAGSKPDIGRAAAEESMEELLQHLRNTHMVFITAGMGGGTGTGAAPVIAQAARDQGLLTVGVVTKPFHFEGSQRMRIAERGIEELQQYVDTLIIIPNQNLFRVANEKTTFADAFKMADDVLYSGVRGVTDLMVMPGLINLDFADIRTVMGEMGKAMMGTGEAEGDQRAIVAAESAISNPLLEDVNIKGARGVLINITGGADMTLFEVDEAANRIREEVDPDANIIFGSTFDESLDGRMRVSVVATGIEAELAQAPKPQPVSRLAVLARQVKGTQPASEAPPTPAMVADPAPLPVQMHAPADMQRGYAPGPAPTQMRAPAPTPAPAPAPVQAHPAPAGQPSGMGMLFPDMKAQLEEAKAALARMEGHHAPPQMDAPPAQGGATGPLPTDSFIPARPVTADDIARPKAVEARPDPFAEAAFANGGGEDRRSNSALPNLFRKMTGIGRGGVEAPQRMAGQPAAVPSSQRNAPSLAIDPQARPAQSRADEEMLEIPAFLRRQAN